MLQYGATSVKSPCSILSDELEGSEEILRRRGERDRPGGTAVSLISAFGYPHDRLGVGAALSKIERGL